jgi:coenzyme F420-reducing hydrogenase alpha subunit
VALEGELRVGLGLRDGRVAQVQITSTRPEVASALLLGRTRAELAAAVPRLFSLCGVAQAAASALAATAALGETVAPATLVFWRDAVATEMLRDAAWRSLLDVPRWLGEAPSHEAVVAGRSALGLRPDLDDRREDREAIGRAVFGMAAEAWLDRVGLNTLDAFDGWADAGSTATARHLARVRDDDAAMPGDGAASRWLPAHDHAAWLQPWLREAADAPGFARQPRVDGAPAETGALARQHRQPLIAAMLRRSGSRVPARFAARLHELALLLAGQHDTAIGAMALPSGDGVAWVETGRGLLVHQLGFDTADEPRSRVYRIVAPTEWNFHPAGVLPAALHGSPAPDLESVRQRATRVVNSLDPCVACRVEFDHA